MNDLLRKNSEGTITPGEERLLRDLVAEAERLMVGNPKRLARFAVGEHGAGRSGAVPVTVWVKPGTIQR